VPLRCLVLSTIAELGPDTADFKVVDEVLGLVGGGAYAEYVVNWEKFVNGPRRPVFLKSF